MRLALAALFAAALATPAAQAGTWKVNLGAEAPIVSHDSNAGSTSSFADAFRPALNVRLGYAPIDLISFDAEISERFQTNPPPGASGRVGTEFRFGVTFEPPVLPLYFQVSMPVRGEPSPVQSGLRAGAGMTLDLLLARLYLEGLLDFPLGGGTGSPGAFSQQTFSLGGGVQFRF